MSLDRFLADAVAAGCPRDQVENFLLAGLILQPRQLAASAANSAPEDELPPPTVSWQA